MYILWVLFNGMYKVMIKGCYLIVMLLCGVVVSFDGVYVVFFFVFK